MFTMTVKLVLWPSWLFSVKNEAFAHCMCFITPSKWLFVNFKWSKCADRELHKHIDILLRLFTQSDPWTHSNSTIQSESFPSTARQTLHLILLSLKTVFIGYISKAETNHREVIVRQQHHGHNNVSYKRSKIIVVNCRSDLVQYWNSATHTKRR